MQVNFNSSCNFGTFIGWRNLSKSQLTGDENQKLNTVKSYLDVKQSNNINIIGEIGELENTSLAKSNKIVRFRSTPLLADFVEIRKQRPGAMLKDYERVSKWFSINNPELKFEARDYLDRQIKYLKFCKLNSNHSSTHIIKRK